MAKVLVSLDDQLLSRLDEEASRRKVTRSALVTQLVARGLGEPVGPGVKPRVRQALTRLDELFARYPDGPDAETAIRRTRDQG